ncbi:MAG TPA: hypothetical protein VLV54_18785 [Thermoanaerobaculia bacterium]|nr:hypothetical protein [Thermoanaerobaculia bacterium]
MHDSPDFPDSMPLIDARRQFFAASGIDQDGGYKKSLFWLGLKWFRVPVPNTAGRVRAVRLHDLHHIATGYPTTWRGEAEIAAWELAGGCGRYVAAWVLNLYAFAVGIFIAPHALWRAFLRGRRCRNLYEIGFQNAGLQAPVGDLRWRLGLLSEAPAGSVRAALAFTKTVVAALSLCAVTVAVPASLAALLLVALGKNARQKRRDLLDQKQ